MTTNFHFGVPASFEESGPSGEYGTPEGDANRGTPCAGWMAADSTGASPIPTVQG